MVAPLLTRLSTSVTAGALLLLAAKNSFATDSSEAIEDDQTLHKLFRLMKKHRGGLKRDPEGPFSFLTSPAPSTDNLPGEWDWRNVDGVDYTSPQRDQHQPNNYCGGCWAFSTTSHLNDRFNVARQNAWPKVMVSPQVLLTCGPSYERGCSDGGDPNKALKFFHDRGAVPDTCHNYEALDLKCNALNVCQDCVNDEEHNTSHCAPRHTFPVYRVKEYGSIIPIGNISSSNSTTRNAVIEDMVMRMKAEVYARGPIVCAMACPDPTPEGKKNGSQGYVEDYTPFFNDLGDGKPYKPFVMDHVNFTCANGDWDECCDHNVVVSGWGRDEETGKPYWLVRNSWGEWWGEFGWFRIVMGKNMLGIESRCDFGIPEIQPDGMPFFMGTSEDIIGFNQTGKSADRGTSKSAKKRNDQLPQQQQEELAVA